MDSTLKLAGHDAVGVEGGFAGPVVGEDAMARTAPVLDTEPEDLGDAKVVEGEVADVALDQQPRLILVADLGRGPADLSEPDRSGSMLLAVHECAQALDLLPVPAIVEGATPLVWVDSHDIEVGPGAELVAALDEARVHAGGAAEDDVTVRVGLVGGNGRDLQHVHILGNRALEEADVLLVPDLPVLDVLLVASDALADEAGVVPQVIRGIAAVTVGTGGGPGRCVGEYRQGCEAPRLVPLVELAIGSVPGELAWPGLHAAPVNELRRPGAAAHPARARVLNLGPGADDTEGGGVVGAVGEGEGRQ